MAIGGLEEIRVSFWLHLHAISHPVDLKGYINYILSGQQLRRKMLKWTSLPLLRWP